MRTVERLAARLLRAMDAACTRLYGWRFNPLHQSGATALLLLLVLIITGLYLLVFYRVSAPWASVSRITADPYLGGPMRSVHRFASDAMVIAALLHAFRMFAQERSWGPRALAWVSGVTLLLFVFVSGWTGFVIVWDTFGAQLAIAGARLFDALPVLSEPVRRVFSGERAIPSAFFFVNLFLHVAVPLVVAAGLFLHVSRVARPTLLPPRPLGIVVVVGLIALSFIRPAPLPAEADPFSLPVTAPGDLVYGFWLPWISHLPAWVAWLGALATLGLAVLVPTLTRRPRVDALARSVVDERVCTGCNQCPQDCPWEAIDMRARTDGRVTLVAHVNPDLCVSCGICAGSCAPMGVGPPLRNGRDQVAAVRLMAREFHDAPAPVIVVMACANTPQVHRSALATRGAHLREVSCTGNIHSSAIELTLRGGAAGVMVLSCPPRDCRGREGPKWLEQRLYHDREAELQPRVDRARVRLATSAAGDLSGTLATYDAFANDVRTLGRTVVDLEEVAVWCDSPVTIGQDS